MTVLVFLAPLKILSGVSTSHHKEKSPCSMSYCGLEKVAESGVKVSCINCFLKKGSLYRFKYEASLEFLYAKARGGTCTMAKSDPLEDVMHRTTNELESQGRSGQANMVRPTRHAKKDKDLVESVTRIATYIPRSFSKRENKDLGHRNDVVKVPVEELSFLHVSEEERFLGDNNRGQPSKFQCAHYKLEVDIVKMDSMSVKVSSSSDSSICDTPRKNFSSSSVSRWCCLRLLKCHYVSDKTAKEHNHVNKATTSISNVEKNLEHNLEHGLHVVLNTLGTITRKLNEDMVDIAKNSIENSLQAAPSNVVLTSSVDQNVELSDGKQSESPSLTSAFGSPNPSSLSEKIHDTESQMLEGKLVFVDDDEKVLKPKIVDVDADKSIDGVELSS
ncbi:putative LRAT-like domain-containing protein [Tanacetum coccineum]